MPPLCFVRVHRQCAVEFRAKAGPRRWRPQAQAMQMPQENCIDLVIIAGCRRQYDDGWRLREGRCMAGWFSER